VDEIELTLPVCGTKRKRNDKNITDEEHSPRKPLVRQVLHNQSADINMDEIKEHEESRPRKPLVRRLPKYLATHGSGALQWVSSELVFSLLHC
jgi:hypothetical protein